jgi:hypothetical protein
MASGTASKTDPAESGESKRKGKIMGTTLIRPYVCAQVVTATQEIVDALLALNTNNRHVKKSIVERYARDINEGKWQLTNQGIGVSSTGVLLDGQHRLEALKTCNYPPVQFLLVTGLADSSQSVVDQHCKRGVRDVFKLSFNVAVSHAAPAICNIFAKFEPSSPVYLAGSAAMTIDEHFEVFSRYQEAIDAICSNVTVIKFFSAPVLAAAVYHSDCQPAKTTDILLFLESVRTGEMLSKDMPAYHVRTLLMNRISNTGGSKVQLERYAKCKKAIAAHLCGVEMRALRV